MLDTVKNKIQRNALINLLTFIVTGTESPAGYAFVPKEEAEKLAKAEPTFITLDPSITNAEGQIKATASTIAIEAVNAPKPAATEPVEKAAKPEPMKYQVVYLDEVPSIDRGGNKSESYQFDQLAAPDMSAVETGGKPKYAAFYVPATEARPNPSKALASTVASANKRHAKSDKAEYTVRKHVVDGKVAGAHVIRIK